MALNALLYAPSPNAQTAISRGASPYRNKSRAGALEGQY